jgi:two-component system, OmpR family, sensor histidine kinase KdpD
MRGYFWTVALVALATGLGQLGHAHLAEPDVDMLYVLVVGVSSVMFSRRTAIFAAALAAGAYDFFFVPPVGSLAINDERYLLTFAMMFVVALITSGLTARVRRARVEELRSALLSAVSHDLRTPLAAITGAATTLREGDRALTPAQKADLLGAICLEAERLEQLVGNLLEMTRLASGTLRVKREWVPVEELVGSALTRLESRLNGRPVRTELPADLPLVSVDPVLAEQVFVNLVENVVKYTPPGSPLEISARTEPGHVVIDVADRGPGIRGGQEGRIFEKFFRGEHPGVSGAGLGLAICRGIVEAHGGKLSAENREGGGALFRIRLPRLPEAPNVPTDLEREVGKAS